MDRRTFVVGGLAGLGIPIAAEPQQPVNLPRVVLLSLSEPPDHVQAFKEGLQALGYTPGATIAIDHRSAHMRAALLPRLAKETVALQPQVIVAVGTTAAIAARQATRQVPIVTVAGDIVAAGLVYDVARPRENVTGLSFFAVDVNLKRFELLMDVVPQLRHLAIVIQSPPTPTLATALAQVRAAARTRQVDVREMPLTRVEDMQDAFANLRPSHVDALLLIQSPIFDVRAHEIGRLTAEHRLVAMLPWREYVQGGGLIAYAPDILALWRRAASYVDRLLRGATVADLPIEQPTKFEMVINLKTAKALGLTIPPSLLLRADQVIE